MVKCEHPNTARLGELEGRALLICLRCAVVLDERAFKRGISEYDAEARENASHD